MKKELTRSQKIWLKKNYPNTRNDKIIEYLGIGKTVLERLKKEMRLKKSEIFMQESRNKGFATMKAMGWPPKGYAIPNRELAWAKTAERSKNKSKE